MFCEDFHLLSLDFNPCVIHESKLVKIVLLLFGRKRKKGYFLERDKHLCVLSCFCVCVRARPVDEILYRSGSAGT